MNEALLELDNLTVIYGKNIAINRLSLPIPEKQITAVIGPSGCGKTTLLRAMNRMHDFVEGVTVRGAIHYQGRNIYDADTDPELIRRRVGMVFQKANPFPRSIYHNVAWGPEINRLPGDINFRVETALTQAALWDEVHEKLGDNAMSLSGGQQQRLCIARALAMQPEVILMDEPCSGLDPVSTSRIEDLLYELKEDYTIVIVTHNMQQAARVSDYTAFIDGGVLVEYGETEQLFTNPEKQRTEDYVTGRFG